MKQKSLVVNVVLNTFKQALTVIFPLITFPYISRTLGVTEFGRYQFAVSIVSYFMLFAMYGTSNFGIREGVRIREDRSGFSQFASEIFTFNLLTTVMAYILLAGLVFWNSRIRSYYILIAIQSLCMLFSALGMDWINTVYEDYLYITVRYIVIQVLAILSIFLFVKDRDDTAIYCFIIMCGSYGGNLLNLLYLRKYIHIRLDFKFSFRKIIIPLTCLFINSVAVIIYVNSDITMLGIFMTDKDVGVYSFASKIYNILKYMINAAVVVAVPRLASLANKSDLFVEKVRAIEDALLVFLLPIAVGLFSLSDSILMIVGGKEYIAGSMVLKVLSFSMVFALCASIHSNCVLIVYRLEKKCLIATIASAAINIVANLFLIPAIGISGAAITTAMAELVNLMIQSYYSRKYVLLGLKTNPKKLLASLIESGIVFCVCSLVNVIWNIPTVYYCVLKVFVAITVSSLIYLPILYVCKKEILYAVIHKVERH